MLLAVIVNFTVFTSGSAAAVMTMLASRCSPKSSPPNFARAVS